MKELFLQYNYTNARLYNNFHYLKNLEFALFNIMNNIGQILLTLLIYFYIAVFNFISNCFIISIAKPCFFACFTK